MSGVKAFGVLAFLMLAGAAQAAVNVTLVDTLNGAQIDKVGAILDQQQRNLQEACTKVKVLKLEVLSVAEPVVLDATRVPVTGVWRARYVVDACGTPAMRSVEMTVVKGGIAIEALVPGETLADKGLQRDVEASFELAGRVAMPQCAGSLVMRDTKVRAYPKTTKDRWQEVWIGSMCGRDLGQMVEFLPTAKGTTFKMSLPTTSVK
jgi:hypothetical protein